MSTVPSDDASWLLIKPIGDKHQTKTWGASPLVNVETKTEANAAGIGTTSRLQRRAAGPHQIRKGSFVEKNKKMDAPNLVSVVSAPPQVKKRAAIDARARYLKIEEYRKTKSSRTRVSRPPLKQPKKEWTNMITSSSHGKKPKNGFGATKKKSKSTGDIAIADWKAAYQDVLSPTSGNRRCVARQDLSASEKVTSPKKKVRGKTKASSAPSFTFPSLLPLSDDEDGDDDDKNDVPRPTMAGTRNDPHLQLRSIGKNKGEEASVLSKASSRKTPISVAISDDDDEEETKSVKSRDSAATPNGSSLGGSSGRKTRLPAMVSPIAETDDVDDNDVVAEPDAKADKEETFEDFDDFDDFTENMEDEEQDEVAWEEPKVAASRGDEDYVPATGEPQAALVSSQHTDKTPTEFPGVRDAEDDKQQEKQPPKERQRSKQLILEFTVPALTGEPDSGDNNDIGLEVPVDVLSHDDISSVGSWPSIESEDSYNTRMNKMLQRWVDIHGGDEDNFRYDNDVQLDDNVLDHIVLAAPDLEKAIQKFEELTGIMPTHVGPLQGLGAKTAHVGLDNNRYIEILAPDDEDPGPLGEELKKLQDGSLTPYHYAIRSSEVSRLIEGYVYDVLGWDPDHIAMVQALPNNSLRQWDLLTMYGHDMGGAAPYYVKWNDHARHPTACIPLNATLTSFKVRVPKGHDVHKLITGVGGLDIEYGEPLLECVLKTPNGSVTFCADEPLGLVFPGYKED
jgi:hypothetical protein